MGLVRLAEFRLGHIHVVLVLSGFFYLYLFICDSVIRLSCLAHFADQHAMKVNFDVHDDPLFHTLHAYLCIMTPISHSACLLVHNDPMFHTLHSYLCIMTPVSHPAFLLVYNDPPFHTLHAYLCITTPCFTPCMPTCA